jgi:hypothetical protein
MATRSARAALAGDGLAGSYVEWSAIFAGAVGASAISFLLLTFGGAIGLSLTSPLPNSTGVSAWGLLIGVAWWAVMVQIGSFFVGGYLAGRMRAPFGDAALDESQFRDSAHGFLVWAVGVLMMVLLAAGAGGATLKAASQSVSAFAGAAGPLGDKSNNVGTTDYATDLLLRRTAGTSSSSPSVSLQGQNIAVSQGGSQGNSNDQAQRDEIKRVFAVTIAKGELNARDRDYLAQVVGSRNGISQEDARSRVDQTVQDTQQYEMQARQAAEKARKTAVISGFLAAASLLISLAAAVGGAALGGGHRDEGTVANLFGTRFW